MSFPAKPPILFKMKKNILILLGFGVIIILFSSEIWSDNGKAGYTGASGESTCVNCHNSYALNSGGGSVMARSNMINWQYEPGQTYNIEVVVARNGNHLFGLGFESLDQANQNAGNLIVTDAAHTQIKSRTVSSVSRRNIVHTLNGGSGADSAVFAFQWTAPTTNIGDVTFSYCGLAANAAGNEAGDYVYRVSQLVSPMQTTAINNPNGSEKMLYVQNPATENLAVRYIINKPGKVEMTLFSLDGKLVKYLISLEQQSGNYYQTLEGLAAYPKGVYLLKVLLNGKVLSEKIVLE